MKKTVCMCVAVTMLFVASAFSAEPTVNFDQGSAQPVGVMSVLNTVNVPMLSSQKLLPELDNSVTPKGYWMKQQYPRGLSELTEILKTLENCSPQAHNSLLKSAVLFNENIKIGVVSFQKLYKCLGEDKTVYLLNCLAEIMRQHSCDDRSQQVTEDGCVYYWVCADVCLERDADGTCLEWGGEVCWWELQYCTTAE